MSSGKQVMGDAATALRVLRAAVQYVCRDGIGNDKLEHDARLAHSVALAALRGPAGMSLSPGEFRELRGLVLEYELWSARNRDVFPMGRTHEFM